MVLPIGAHGPPPQRIGAVGGDVEDRLGDDGHLRARIERDLGHEVGGD